MSRFSATGRPWRRTRTAVLATSTTCVLCGHGGSGDVHHLIPLSVLAAIGGDPLDPANLRPAHGSASRCPDCGRCCNQEQGDRLTTPQRRRSRRW